MIEEKTLYKTKQNKILHKVKELKIQIMKSSIVDT